jgi:carbonic anhydrase/acetyltransferase-like protein (isoleucine patch superfamily)
VPNGISRNPRIKKFLWVLCEYIAFFAILKGAIITRIPKTLAPLAIKRLKMSLIIEVKGSKPSFGNNCYLAPNATVAGDVIMGDDCSIWFNAVIRGDVNSIRMGNKVNVQDGAVIHCTYLKAATVIGNNVSIGHNAIVHGCVIDDNVLVGMGAIVMDNAKIGSNSIIAAGAVVLENTIVDAGSIYAGVPAKKVKNIPEEMIEGEIDRIAGNYVMYASWFMG